jgi:hypothetical protein
MKDLMEWSRGVINSLMEKANNVMADYLFQIKITLNPNPLDYDGIDEVLMEVIEENQSLKLKKVVFSTKNCCSINEAQNQINNWASERLIND